MTRQERLDKLMAAGMSGYDAPPHYPSTAPYMDDFGIGQNEAPAPAPFPFRQYWPLILIVGAVLWMQK